MGDTREVGGFRAKWGVLRNLLIGENARGIEAPGVFHFSSDSSLDQTLNTAPIPIMAARFQMIPNFHRWLFWVLCHSRQPNSLSPLAMRGSLFLGSIKMCLQWAV